MSTVSDLLDRIRSELNDRLVVLKPAADEYARLQRAVAALDGVQPAAVASRPASPPPAARAPRAPARAATSAKPVRRRRATRSGAERAAPGQTQLRVIEQLRSAPGSSSTAVAKALGISANAAAATISRLVKQGRVSRLDTGGYAAAPAPVAPPAPPGAAPADAEPAVATPAPTDS